MNVTSPRYDLRLIDPLYGSDLVTHIQSLDRLRVRGLSGTTPFSIFKEIKATFAFLESWSSTRIEGNGTTLAHLVDIKDSTLASKPETEKDKESRQEWENVQIAQEFLDQEISEGKDITHELIQTLHQKVTGGLSALKGGEGDLTPGFYRLVDVSIKKSTHTPPHHKHVWGLMDDLLKYINKSDKPQYDMIKIAVAHHCFCWIHPFGNGNGRVVRLLTHALMIKFGFGAQSRWRILNPAAVFWNDRDLYIKKLNEADTLKDEGLLEWCNYMLSGIAASLQKIINFTEKEFVYSKIIFPALDYMTERKVLTTEELHFLKAALLELEMNKDSFSASQVGKRLSLTAAQVKYRKNNLLKRKMIVPIHSNARRYKIVFSQGPLLRGLVHSLVSQGLVHDQEGTFA